MSNSLKTEKILSLLTTTVVKGSAVCAAWSSTEDLMVQKGVLPLANYICVVLKMAIPLLLSLGEQTHFLALPILDNRDAIYGSPCQKDAFLCAAKGVQVGIEFQKRLGTDQSDIFLMLSEELENGDFEGFGI